MSIAGGETAVSVFLEFFAKLASYDQILNFVTEKQVIRQLKEWQKILPSIQAVLNDAEEKQMKDPNVEIWLTKLQNLGYDVGDALDEFAVEALHRKSHEDEANSSKAQKPIASWFNSFINSRAFTFNKKMISKLEEISDELNGLARAKARLGLREIDETAISNRVKSSLQLTSLVGEKTHVFGREKEKAEILELLLGNHRNENEALMIHIFGFGGIGKTTLARLVYSDDNVKKSFNHRFWIRVTKDFDVTLATKNILQSIFNLSCIVPTLDNLQAILKGKLFGKHFLLVLDNVRNENYDDLVVLLKPFGVGTKVILISRSCDVSPVVGNAKAYLLQNLSYGDCLSVFTHHALKASDFSGHQELEKVGKNIVNKCNGLPLAAKVIGSLLGTRVEYGVWKDVSESEIWDLPEERCSVIPALLLSYHYLPSYLKRCFAYCSLVPKDYEFEEEEIILLWKAEGFLQQTNSKTHIEDLGSRYFRDLVSRSFFQTSVQDKYRFVMHDLINDLAQLVSGEICLKLEEDKQPKIPNDTRHSSYVCGSYDGVDKFAAFDHMKRLRTFLPFMLPRDETCCITNTVLVDLLPKLRCLRVLSLKGYCITVLPDVFENLVQLRYLNFSHTLIKSLPASVCTLYNLETLLLKESRLEWLPKEIDLLVNLNHLDISGVKMKSMPLLICKLTDLRRLSDFILGAGDGRRIRELRNLHLKGDLCLSGLENIVETQDALEAKLIDKPGLDVLRLMWSTNFDNGKRDKTVEEELLKMLEPHRDLKVIVVENYGGTKFPSWIADSSFKNLWSLDLNNCRNCESLPSVGNLPLLKDLCIRGMHEVTKVGIEFFGENQPNTFASLETLCFKDMLNWKEWDFDEVDKQVAKFPHLCEFCIVNCPQLSGRFPNSLCSLEILVIRQCKQLVVSVSNLPLLYDIEIDGCKELVLSDVADFPPLRKVSLSNISKLSPLTEKLVSGLSNLEHLSISSCNNLVSLPWEQFASVRDLRSLRSLEMSSFTEIEFEERQLQLEKASNIESLTIANFEKLHRLPQDLHFLTFLTEMQIKGCRSLVLISMNNLPPALKRLVIIGCTNLQCLVDQGENTTISNTCSLEHLEIMVCPLLVSLSLPIRLQILMVANCSRLTSLSSSGELPSGLKQLLVKDCLGLESIVQAIHETSSLELLEICRCGNFKSLPQGLNKLNHVEKINILLCQNLVSLTASGLPTRKLESLWISGCQSLADLPNVHKLTSLKKLSLYDCSPDLPFPEEGLPTSLTSISITVPKLCHSLLKWGLHKLTSLKELFIDGQECSHVVTFPPEGCVLPPTLTGITIINFENLRSLSTTGFRNVDSLRELWLLDCPEIESLPEKDVLLSVWKLYIRRCHISLLAQLIMNQGPEWLKISHMPEVIADRQSIIPKATWE
ncbi:putative Purine permease 11 [Hibiscus syriacus]|uniref:Purine permease 11 n=1 Tax=Hibiscus syriacus TaxID=106335 RepID=A0A6A2YL66_HIBSY|nr:putative disease resistance RPP13-like protein 1 [Hibiscus syriacus]KAE8680047.1 putative Purine permease 11 [Hibiscus syriacus]